MKKIVMLSFALLGVYSVSMAEVKKLNSEQEVKQLIKKNDNVILKITTTPCEGCRIIAAPFSDIAQEYSRKVVFAEVDKSKVGTIKGDWKITSYPGIVFFKGGSRVDTSCGGSAGDEAKNWLRHMISKHFDV